MSCRVCFSGFLLFLVCSLYSQDSEIKFRQITVEDGLSQNWIRCISQDKYGFMWFGTRDGLNRYDGYNFKIYKLDQKLKNSLSNNHIKVIFEDSRGNLWIGAQGGLNIYDRKRDEFIPLSFTLDYSIEAIAELSSGDLLIGSPEGLFFIDQEDMSFKELNTEMYVNAILIDNNNNIWLGTYSGLCLFNQADCSVQVFRNRKDDKKSISENIIRSMAQDSQGRIWVGTDTKGLNLLRYIKEDPFHPEFINYSNHPDDPESIGKGAVLALLDDKEGNLWIGLENGGLDIIELDDFKENRCVFKHYLHNEGDSYSISNNSIHSIYRDKSGTIWAGTYAMGINYYNKLLHKFEHYKHLPNNSHSINNNHVNVIYDEADKLWIGTEGGLNVLDKKRKTIKHYTYDFRDDKTIGADPVWSILRDSYGNMWIGTWSGGLNLFDETSSTFTRYLHDENDENSIGGNSVFGLAQDQEGNLWIASMLGGLNRYDYGTNTFKSYLHEDGKNSISNNWVRDILISSYNEVWMSTMKAVDVFDINTGLFRSYTHDVSDTTSISYNGAVVIFEDSKRNIWIGTESGLNVYRRESNTFKSYFEEDGLPNNALTGICEDDNGNLWLSTNHGISKFVDGIHQPECPEFKNYDMWDGLQGNEFNRRSFCKGIDGRMYFGGTNGYNVFHPDSIKDNKWIPDVVLTGFYINNQSVDYRDKNSPLTENIHIAKEIRLLPKHMVFTIEYAALNYIASEKNHYAFILEGFEKEWNNVGTQRTATYTNLDPGRYVFKVKASNNDGYWNKEGRSLVITILPAWWQTWWAKALYALFILLALYFFRKYTLISVNFKNQLWKEHLQREKTEELNRMKIRFFTNISHELRTPLTLISGPIEQLINKGSKSKELELIKRSVFQLRKLVDQILDFRKIDSEEMPVKMQENDIVSCIKQTIFGFFDYAEQKGIKVIFRSGIHKLNMDFDKEKIDKIFTNLLMNALNYTQPGGTVSVNLTVHDEKPVKNEIHLVIEISDTGKGIPKLEIDKIFNRFYTSDNQNDTLVGTGIGLHLTKSLVEMHGGEINVTSKEKEGTVFTVVLPARNGKLEIARKEIVLQNNISGKSSKMKVENQKSKIESHKKTIIVIDDNIDICSFIESILISEFNIIKEINPEQGMELILKYMPDLVISDVMMPGMNGFELCERIKSDIRISHIPVILLTAKATVEDHILGFDTGADEYIYKPFDIKLLRSRVRNMIRQKEVLRKHLIGMDGKINSDISVNSLDKSFMDKIFNIILDNHHNPDFTVNNIIDEIGMSRSVFYKKFKALSNSSIHDLIKQIRLKKACDLMNDNSLTIAEVAYRSGFNDPSYFSRVFRETYQVTPKDYILQKNTTGG
ncbi:MAG: response regulator [Bacteroidales bacterium]|nr:response regulator [Bacteroidales bacterium]